MLTFNQFQTINAQRCKRWHKGGISDWSLSDWAVALGGETGELLNVVKKLNRERDGITGNTETEADLRNELALEIADVITYAFILAESEGIDVEQVCALKFNKVSEKNNFPERI